MEDRIFRELFEKAQFGDEASINELIKMFKGILKKYSVIDGKIDEDCMQELALQLIKCIKSFKLNEPQDINDYLHKKAQEYMESLIRCDIQK